MKKKVLFVFHESDPLSGGNASMLDVIKNINNTDAFEIIGLVPSIKSNKPKVTVGDVLNGIGIPTIEAVYFSSRYQCEKPNIKESIKVIKCIVRNTISMATCIYLWLKLRRRGISVIYTNTTEVYIGAFLAKLLNIKHIWHFREFGKEDQNAHHLMGDKLFYKMANFLSSKIIVISHALESKVLSYIDDSKVKMIYDDLCVPDIPKLKTKPIGDKLNILMVGTLSQGKGQLSVIKALTALKEKRINFQLAIAGHDDTEYANFLKEQTALLNMSQHVKFLGFSRDIRAIREEYDIGIVASRSEAFGRVTIEGMCSGLIMIASNLGANSELIEKEYNGFIYDNDNELISILEVLNSNRIDINEIRERAYSFSSDFLRGINSKKIEKLILCE